MLFICNSFQLACLLAEVYRLVKEVRQSVFRPTLLDTDDEDLLNMIRRCWSEEPSDRPDFSVVKGMIRRINKYVDALLSLLCPTTNKSKLHYFDARGLIVQPEICCTRSFYK